MINQIIVFIIGLILVVVVGLVVVENQNNAIDTYCSSLKNATRACYSASTGQRVDCDDCFTNTTCSPIRTYWENCTISVD